MASSLVSELASFCSSVLRPSITIPEYVRVHPKNAKAFLHVPTNAMLVIEEDDGIHPRYRPLFRVKKFLQTPEAKRAHQFWSKVLHGVSDLCSRKLRTDLWASHMGSGSKLPFQVIISLATLAFILVIVMNMQYS